MKLFATFFAGLCLFVGLQSATQAQSTSDDPFKENFQDFRNWQATCYDDGSCLARTMVKPGSGEAGEAYRLRLAREGGEFSSFVLSLMTIDAKPGTGELLNVRVVGGPAFALADGAGYGVFSDKNLYYFTDQATLDALLPAMMQGSQMSASFRDERGETRTANISLLGLGAAIKFMNKQQFRGPNTTDIGPPAGVTSAADQGDKSNLSPLQLPSGLVALHSQVEACEGWAGRPSPQNASNRYDLGDNTNLYIVPCTPGTNNPGSRIYIAEKGGRLDAVLFARFDEETGWTGTDTLANAAFDKSKGILVSQYREQGLDGCGILALWKWQDGRFAMDRYAAWRDCEVQRPVTEWEVIYLRAPE